MDQFIFFLKLCRSTFGPRWIHYHILWSKYSDVIVLERTQIHLAIMVGGAGKMSHVASVRIEMILIFARCGIDFDYSSQSLDFLYMMEL